MSSDEKQLEDELIKKLRDLKYEYRADIRDRAALEKNFRQKFEALNQVKLTNAEFERLLGDIVTADVFAAAHTLRNRNAFTRDDGTPLNYTLVNIADWCKNTFEVVSQLTINTVYSHHRYDVVILINGVPCAQIELKTLGINPRRAMEQIVEYKNDKGNGYTNNILCFVQLFIVSNRTDNTSSGIPHISAKQIKEFTIDFPTEAEQQKIADCLTSLDEVIAAQGRKVAALADHKRGLMQQLFPREGETLPRLRFPEFRDAPEWEERPLSSAIHLVSGVHLSPEQYSTDGDLPYFTGPSDFRNDIESVEKWTAASSNAAKADDTLITVKGSGVGELWYLAIESVAMGRQLMAVRVTKASARFVYYFLSTKRSRFEDLASGNLIPGLSRGDILDMPTRFPLLPEQQRIAACLSALDAQITAESAKRDGLKTHKKALMQQLFPAAEAVAG